MIREIRSSWLLRQAAELCEGLPGAGQPRNADLRRATSAAYYALFHALSREVSKHALPARTQEMRLRFTRRVRHQSIADACGVVAGNSPGEHLDDVGAAVRSDPSIVTIAQAFSDLRERRELADHDHFADFTRPGTRSDVRTAQEAVKRVTASSGSDGLGSCCALVLLKMR